MQNFPDLIGLDIAVCPPFDFDGITAENFSNRAETSPATFLRYPDTAKPTTVRLKSGALAEMIPLCWGSEAKPQQEAYHMALQTVSTNFDLDRVLAGCAAASPARKILYADSAVHAALEFRWEMARKGQTLEQSLQNLGET